MGIELDERYQVEAYEQVKIDFEEGNKSCIVFPTGCGKSYIALKLIEENPDKKVTYITSSPVLIDQLKKMIEEVYKKPYNTLYPNLRFITYNALSRMNEGEINNLQSDIIVLDELHRAGAPIWGKGVNTLLETRENAKILGLTATSVRTDGRNMAEEICGGISYELPLTEAVARGVLPVPEYICVQYIFEENVKKVEEMIEQLDEEDERKGKYRRVVEEVRRHLDNSKGIDDILKKHIKHKDGKYIVFCRNIEDINIKAAQVKKWFGEVQDDIQVRKISSDNERNENFQELNFFRSKSNLNSLQLALAVNMLNEGFHDSSLNGVLMTRPTMSEILFRQQLGRALAMGMENTPQIFDLVNNIRYFEHFRREIKEIIEKGTKTPGGKSKYDIGVLDQFKVIEEQITFIEEFKKVEENLREILNKSTYDKVIEWLEKHNGELPRFHIMKDGKSIKRGEMTEDEKYGVNLRFKWEYYSIENEILKKYAGQPIEEVPEEYREKISTLRGYGLGIIEEEKSIYEQFIEWVEKHDGRVPRSNIKGKHKVELMTEEENNEVNLYAAMRRSDEYKVLKKYAGQPLENVPEDYREKIQKLRELGLAPKSNEALGLVDQTLEVLQVLKQNGVRVDKIEACKRVNGKNVRILLKDIEEEGIDIEKIIDAYGLNKNFKLGNNITHLKQSIKGTGKYTITGEQRRQIEELGLVKKRPIEELIEVAKILKENGIDFGKIRENKRENGKSVFILLKDIEQEGVDIIKIIAENGLDEKYNLGYALYMIKRVYRGSKQDIIVNDDEIKQLEDIGVLRPEMKEKKGRITAQKIGQATFDAPIQGCDEA